MKNKLNFFTIFFMSIILVSCSNDDSNKEVEESIVMRAKIDGVLWEVRSLEYSNIINLNQSNTQTYELEGITDTYKIQVNAMQAVQADCMIEKTYSGDDAGVAIAVNKGNNIYVFDLSSYPTGSPYTSENSSKVNITKCFNGTISGTFSSTFYKLDYSIDFDNPTIVETIEVTDGEFNNIPYDVLENDLY